MNQPTAPDLKQALERFKLFRSAQTGERIFRRAHGPDMQVMRGDHAGPTDKEIPHRRGIDLRRDRGHGHADGIAQ